MVAAAMAAEAGGSSGRSSDGGCSWRWRQRQWPAVMAAAAVATAAAAVSSTTRLRCVAAVRLVQRRRWRWRRRCRQRRRCRPRRYCGGSETERVAAQSTDAVSLRERQVLVGERERRHSRKHDRKREPRSRDVRCVSGCATPRKALCEPTVCGCALETHSERRRGERRKKARFQKLCPWQQRSCRCANRYGPFIWRPRRIAFH